MIAIFKRELKAYFTSVIGYIFLAVFFLFEGLFFTTVYSAGAADISGVIMAMSTVIVFITPVLTMRMLSEDRRQKVDQALLTAPVSVFGIVAGKFLAALTVFVSAFAPTLIFQFIVSAKVDSLNWLLYLNSLLGVVLTGAAIIAIGMFISSITESQVISCILTVSAFIVLLLVTSLASLTGIEWISAAAEYIAIFDRFAGFGESVFHIVDVVYLLTVAALFIFLSIRSVERRRWA